MDFSLPPRVEDFRSRIARFVEADRTNWDAHGNIVQFPLDRLRDKARAEGLWCLQLRPESGGQGLDKVGMAACYEEMNRSILGPVVFNGAAPDDGHMMVLNRQLADEGRDVWRREVAA